MEGGLTLTVGGADLEGRGVDSGGGGDRHILDNWFNQLASYIRYEGWWFSEIWWWLSHIRQGQG